MKSQQIGTALFVCFIRADVEQRVLGGAVEKDGWHGIDLYRQMVLAWKKTNSGVCVGL